MLFKLRVSEMGFPMLSISLGFLKWVPMLSKLRVSEMGFPMLSKPRVPQMGSYAVQA
jgi:hypothetical protein